MSSLDDMAAVVISPESFPTPDLALRSNDRGAQERAREFAMHQAVTATDVAYRLVRDLTIVTAPWERASILEAAHLSVVGWRYQLARTAHATGAARLGTGNPWTPDRYRVALIDARYDRIGRIGRLRDGASWDNQARTYLGGTETPASRVMARTLRRALDRWQRESQHGDRLANTWTTTTGDLLYGSQVLRGPAAADAAYELRTRVAGRGLDVSRFDTGTDPNDTSPMGGLYYLATSDPHSRAHLHEIALRRLAELIRHRHNTSPADLRRGWDTAVWLLYQAPRIPKGSDAVTRVFAVAVGALLLGAPPVMRHDVDLRALVLDLPTFLAEGGAAA